MNPPGMARSSELSATEPEGAILSMVVRVNYRTLRTVEELELISRLHY